MTLFSWSGGFPTLAVQCSNPLVDLKDEKLQMKLQPTQMVETEFSLQVDSVVRARKWFLSQHHNALDNSTMNRLLPVLTVVSWMLIESGMMWSTECAPYSSKPINATRKISQSVTRMTTAPSTTLIPTVTPNQVQSAFQTKTLDGIHLNHSRIMNSIHPEGIVNRPTPNVDEKRNNSSITDRKGDAVNDVVCVFLYYFFGGRFCFDKHYPEMNGFANGYRSIVFRWVSSKGSVTWRTDRKRVRKP